jgi:hypothetical protein
MELFELSDVGVEASKLIVLLIWAAFDGSIIARELLNYFEVIVPEDNKPGSIKSVFTCWFMVLLGIPLSKIKIRWEESEYANGKNIAYLRIYDRRVLGLLASKILSVVTGYELTYLTHDRLDCSEQNAWLLVGRTRRLARPAMRLARPATTATHSATTPMRTTTTAPTTTLLLPVLLV